MKPFDILYKLSRKNKIANHLFSLIYHCDIPMKLKVGNNIRFVHKGLGVVISEGATIGNNVCIQHHVLIGEKKTERISRLSKMMLLSILIALLSVMFGLEKDQLLEQGV